LPNKLKKTKLWFENRVRSGTAENILVTARGAMSNAFFTREGADVEIGADVKKAGIDIGGGWPKVDDVQWPIYLHGPSNRVLADRDAEIFGVDVSDSELKIEKTGTPQATLTLSGIATATVSDLVRYVLESPLNKITKGALKSMVGDGLGKLDLNLNIPLLNRKNTEVNGSINFVGSSLKITDKAPELNRFRGFGGI
jgi:uncharacterized protein YhdP